MKLSRGAVLASFLSFVLAFSVPAPALALISASDVDVSSAMEAHPLSATDETVATSAESESLTSSDGWTYEMRDAHLYVIGYTKPPEPIEPEEPAEDEGDEQGEGEQGIGEAQRSDESESNDSSSGEGSQSSGDGSQEQSESGDDASGEPSQEQGESGDGSASEPSGEQGESGDDASGEPSGEPGETPGQDDEEELVVLPGLQDDGTLIIPETIDDVDVYGIAPYGEGTASEASSVWSNPEFKAITFSASIQDIAAGAFKNCENIKAISFPDESTLDTIGEDAFRSSGITTAPIPASVSTIGKSAFYSCENLASLTIAPDSQLSKIPSYAFARTALEEVALDNCASYLTEIEESAFAQCMHLERVTFGVDSKLSSIGKQAFIQDRLVSIEFNENLKSIGYGAFQECNLLNSATFPEGSLLETIGDYAFWQTSIRAIAIGPNVKTIGVGAFGSCNRLATVTFAGDKLETIGSSAFNKTALSSIELPDGVKTIGTGAFRACASLESVMLDENLESIGDRAFSECKKLKELVMPEGLKVTTIGDEAFMYAALPSITLNSSLVTIGSSAFAFCEDLAEVTIPTDSALETIKASAFANTGIESISFNAGLKYIGAKAFESCSTLSSVVFPVDSALEQINEAAFSDTRLTSVFIPESVTIIGSNAFSGSKSLGEVAGCVGLERVEAGAFSDTNLAAFPYGNKLKFLSGTAFSDSALYSAKNFPTYLEYEGGDYYRWDTTVAIRGAENYEMAFDVLNCINAERPAGKGLVMSSDLMKAAMKRAAELTVRFDRTTRPSGASFTTVADGVIESNVSVGQVNAKTAVQMWMGSSSSATRNRLNILDESFVSAGVGCFTHENVTYFVVLFSDQAAGGNAVSSSQMTSHVDAKHSMGLMSDVYLPNLVAWADGGSTSVKVGDTLMVNAFFHNANNPYLVKPELESFRFIAQNAELESSGRVTFRNTGLATVYLVFKDLSDSSHAAALMFNVEQADVANAVVSGVSNSVYTGNEIKQNVKVVMAGVTLKEGTDYALSYANNRNAGTAYVVITGRGNYKGSKRVAFTISKAAQPMKVSAKTKTVKAKKLKKKALKVSALSVTGAIGSVTYKNASTQKAAKKLKVASMTGAVKVPKKTKKGKTFKMKVKVTATGDANHDSASVTKAFKIKVK